MLMVKPTNLKDQDLEVLVMLALNNEGYWGNLSLDKLVSFHNRDNKR